MTLYVYLIQVFARMKNKLDTKSHRNSLIITLLLAANKAKDKWKQPWNQKSYIIFEI